MVQQRISDAHEFACMADESLRPEARTRSKRLRGASLNVAPWMCCCQENMTRAMRFWRSMPGLGVPTLQDWAANA